MVWFAATPSQECASLRKLIDEQGRAGEDKNALSKQMSASLSAKIQRLKALDADGASTLTSAINEMALSQENTTMLAQVVRTKLISVQTEQTPTSRDGQECALEVFARASDWAVFDDKLRPTSAKLQCIMKLMLDIDLPVPSEAMKARVANFLRHRCNDATANEWTPAEWKKFLDDCRLKLSKMKKQKARGPHLAPFPSDAEELRLQNPAAYMHAYKLEPPEPRACPELGDFPFCRGTHNSLKEDRERGPASGSARVCRPEAAWVAGTRPRVRGAR